VFAQRPPCCRHVPSLRKGERQVSSRPRGDVRVEGCENLLRCLTAAEMCGRCWSRRRLELVSQGRYMFENSSEGRAVLCRLCTPVIRRRSVCPEAALLSACAVAGKGRKAGFITPTWRSEVEECENLLRCLAVAGRGAAMRRAADCNRRRGVKQTAVSDRLL
jgi:hypothetical protein